ncbi:MAG: DUF4058 family protein [Fimbriiglobus sp.]
MPSPLLGMDPYLEDVAHWTSFQTQFMNTLYQTILPSLVDRYRAKVTLREYTTELALFTSVIREPHSEPYLEITSRQDGRLVTLVELVSLANKTIPSSRSAYHETRNHATSVRANTVEIDLITQGQPTLDFARDGLPVHDQTISIARGSSPERFEIYTSCFLQRLPKFRLPLAQDDKDIIVDLQTLYARTYELGGFEMSIDHKAELPKAVKIRPDLETILLNQFQSVKN